eukprot:8834-Pelagococcus_subviridis.AAC.1
MRNQRLYFSIDGIAALHSLRSRANRRCQSSVSFARARRTSSLAMDDEFALFAAEIGQLEEKAKDEPPAPVPAPAP